MFDFLNLFHFKRFASHTLPTSPQRQSKILSSSLSQIQCFQPQMPNYGILVPGPKTLIFYIAFYFKRFASLIRFQQALNHYPLMSHLQDMSKFPQIPILGPLFMCHLCTIYVPFMYHLCTICVPFMYHLCTIYVPFMYHLCTIRCYWKVGSTCL